ncbi:hypothetical protein RND81_09G105300 [Saponaria officinalis]|uniref:Uncharacterized protein n=1 Tax=Saponaria officinalis TaxID=3572 RepID=A0AAW1IKH1_SAPOF
MGKGRRPCCDKAGVKKGPWFQAEDIKLISFIQKHGHSNWRALPKLAGFSLGLARCGKSCRLRWVNYLRPDLKRGNFTPHEEEAIINLHQELGNKFRIFFTKFRPFFSIFYKVDLKHPVILQFKYRIQVSS